MNTVKSEDPSEYSITHRNKIYKTEEDTINEATEILGRRMLSLGDVLSAPATVSQFLVLKLSALEHEVFGCIFLNTRNRVITTEELFRGTIDGSSVYPREVVKRVLKHNASNVIIYHNHPSGSLDPSQADITITERLKNALKLIDVSVLDHIVVSGIETTSFSERGLI